MRWVRDQTGRFAERPHYAPAELDQECERLIGNFLQGKYGAVSYPITTDDLTILIEQHAADLDLYADLSQEGPSVEGITRFFLGEKPKVGITRELSEEPWRENRLRTTLTHELAHVHFHDFLWQLPKPSRLPGFEDLTLPTPVVTGGCKRETLLSAPRSDWMEWQAGYASGAYLMPIGAVRAAVREIFQQNPITSSVPVDDSLRAVLIAQLQLTFQVSEDAARVRLSQLGYLGDRPASARLL